MEHARRAKTLTGLDANFLYRESVGPAMHTIKVLVFEPGSSARLSWSVLRKRVLDVAQRLPPLRRRLLRVPGGLHHPRWLHSKIEIDEHLHHIECSGGMPLESLDKLVGLLLERRLPRDRPLWSAHVVTGLEGERAAVIVRLHHTLADGQASVALLDALSTATRGRWTPPPARTRELPTLGPSRLRLALRGLWSRLLAILSLPALIVRSALRWLRARRRERPAKALFSGAQTFFNGELGRARLFTHLELPLDELRAIKAGFDVSFNDALLAIVSGACATLRDAELLRGPSLTASMPMASAIDDADNDEGDDSSRRRLLGNALANAVVDLHDDLLDRRARVAAIAQSTRAAKADNQLRGPRRLIEWSEHSSVLWQRITKRLLGWTSVPPLNLIVSNVRGPGEHVYIGRTRVDEIWSVGPLVERVGLNLTAWSYAGRVFLSLQADGSQWPHSLLHQLRDAIVEEHRQLLRAAKADPKADPKAEPKAEADETRAA
ncbi:DUF1298 domain-containing protein [Pseudenhygromyxa sp. WMMC2535]|uniref:wax ester/triacylglycerol synthase domain-containing protein n=1 Tax=Pseudenhygromyxa sp. WMMC2535 TaxID=2712867 RepID=UPI0015576738|nr:DUF1298 domain-containing protein [Pseudenhygromyxa sp. WMMC2535]